MHTQYRRYTVRDARHFLNNKVVLAPMPGEGVQSDGLVRAYPMDVSTPILSMKVNPSKLEPFTHTSKD